MIAVVYELKILLKVKLYTTNDKKLKRPLKKVKNLKF